MFRQIVVVDQTGLKPWAIEKLQEYSKQTVRLFDDVPANDDEICFRIGDSDCVLVSWNTHLGAEVLKRSEHLAYVGMCCSLYSAESANVDIEYAIQNGIVVKGIRDYGDEGVAEFVISELIQLFKGLRDRQWHADPVELNNQKIGIIGLGTVGKLLAARLQAFGANVFYYSRTQKEWADRAGIQYLELHDLLSLSQFGNGKILINTSLGIPFECNAFSRWIEHTGNFGIFDSDGAIGIPESILNRPNIAYTPLVTGWTSEAKERLSAKVLANIKSYFQDRD